MHKTLGYGLTLTLVISFFLPFAASAKDQIIGVPNPVPHPCLVLTDTLDEGATDAKSKGQVSKLQKFLADLGELDQADVSGYYGPKTKNALKKYQSKHNIESAGTTGPKTRAHIGRDCAPSPDVSAPVPLLPAVDGVIEPPKTFLGEVVRFLNPNSLLAQIEEIFGGVVGITGQSVNSFSLINADTNLVIATLTSGSTLDLTKLPTTRLNIRANTTPAKIIDRIRFDYDTTSNFVNDYTPPYTIGGDNGVADYYVWTPTVGSHTLKATPYEKNNKTSGTGLSITFKVIKSAVVVPDTTAPAVSISSPTANATVAGTLTATAAATDAIGVTKVEFYVDGVQVGITQTAPHRIQASVTTFSNGTHTLTAKAYDAANNVGTSAGVPININNTLPVLSFIATPQTVSYNTASTLSWSALNATSCTASGAWTGAKAVPSGSMSTGNLTSSQTYTLMCSNGIGNITASVTVNVTDIPDSTLPTVSITSPANNSNVSGDVTISANASDNVGVTIVELYKNGTLHATKSVAPYIFSWTAPAATDFNQMFTFVAKAKDAAGNVGSSPAVLLNVPSNVVPPPPPPAPTLTLSANPTTVTSGASSVLSWVSTNASSCTASGAWTGSKALSGSQSVTPTISSTYTLSCVGLDGSTITKPVTVSVTAPVDTIWPSAFITSPSNNAIVSGSLNVNVTAFDNVGVTKIGLKLDGVAFGSPIFASSGTFTINTAAFTNSTHKLVATSEDAAGHVANSEEVTITINNAVASPVTVQVKNMVSFNELYIEGSPGNDIISISQSGNTVSVTGNGATLPFTGPFGDIVIKGQNGDDTITINNSVTTRSLVYGNSGNNTITAITGSNPSKVTVVTLSGGSDTITGNGNTSYWVGAEDTVNATAAETAAGKVHKITSFANFGSLLLNSPDIQDPTDSYPQPVFGHSLFGTGPKMDDINQGAAADCYYLAGLSALAHTMPDRLEETAVDLGDNTYAVQYIRSGVKSYVRVDNGFDFAFSKPGPASTLWGMVHEKAFAYFRRGTNTYASTNYGQMSEWSVLGLTITGYSDLANTIAGIVNTQLAAKHAMNAGVSTVASGAPLIGNHGYAVVGTNAAGSILMRNPWGPADPFVGGSGVVTVTPTQFEGSVFNGTYAQ